ncbi:MAG: 3-phosphoserine/phosphohydroxythreonine transaminase [Gemmatimonadota bacterium]
MAYNFGAGPAVLPRTVVTEAAAALAGSREGLSILEVSHRGGAYEAIHDATLERCRRLYHVPEDMAILFLQGGASLQFAMVAENLVRPGRSADYLLTGSWSERAMAEARRLGRAHRVAGSSQDASFSYIPTGAELSLDREAEYVHITTNNTIFGTQYGALPDTGPVPLAADMSSDLLSRPVDWTRIGIAYGGAQKNAGIAGLTVVFLRRDLLERERDTTPTILRYSTHVEGNSLYNTPPVFAVYVLGLVLEWIEARGAIEGTERANREKAALVYAVLDELSGFYCGHARPDSRSVMNVTFNLRDRELNSAFCAAAEGEGLIGLKGHRSVGGVRASIYNAMPREGCQALATFMRDFARLHG